LEKKEEEEEGHKKNFLRILDSAARFLRKSEWYKIASEMGPCFYACPKNSPSRKILPNHTIPLGLPWWLNGKNLPAIQESQETWVRYLGGEDPWSRK
jgi:hypothetical protein